LSIQNHSKNWIVNFFSSFRDLDLFPLPDGWEKGFFTTFNPDARDERGLGKLRGASPVHKIEKID
jgi:hypothetical protein